MLPSPGKSNLDKEVRNMGIYRRGKTFWFTYTHEGRRIQRSLETVNRRLAEKIHAKVLTDIIEGRYFETVLAKAMRFEDMAQKYLAERYSRTGPLYGQAPDEILQGANPLRDHHTAYRPVQADAAAVRETGNGLPGAGALEEDVQCRHQRVGVDKRQSGTEALLFRREQECPGPVAHSRRRAGPARTCNTSAVAKDPPSCGPAHRHAPGGDPEPRMAGRGPCPEDRHGREVQERGKTDHSPVALPLGGAQCQRGSGTSTAGSSPCRGARSGMPSGKRERRPPSPISGSTTCGTPSPPGSSRAVSTFTGSRNCSDTKPS